MRLTPHDKWLIEGDEKDEYIIAYDWQGEAIWNYYGDKYFSTEDGYVCVDDARLYLSEKYLPPREITEWEEE